VYVRHRPERPALGLEGDQQTVVRQMAVTLPCDHRVVDGLLGAHFLQALKQHIEQTGD
jgi:pyruvate dehydrogenase E2 component (dihydrolipoamide acetyltransferase)